ncbi:hypothetical protein Tco_0268921 [Tanacetum coccineum]
MTAGIERSSTRVVRACWRQRAVINRTSLCLLVDAQVSRYRISQRVDMKLAGVGFTYAGIEPGWTHQELSDHVIMCYAMETYLQAHRTATAAEYLNQTPALGYEARVERNAGWSVSAAEQRRTLDSQDRTRITRFTRRDIGDADSQSSDLVIVFCKVIVRHGKVCHLHSVRLCSDLVEYGQLRTLDPDANAMTWEVLRESGRTRQWGNSLREWLVMRVEHGHFKRACPKTVKNKKWRNGGMLQGWVYALGMQNNEGDAPGIPVANVSTRVSAVIVCDEKLVKSPTAPRVPGKVDARVFLAQINRKRKRGQVGKETDIKDVTNPSGIFPEVFPSLPVFLQLERWNISNRLSSGAAPVSSSTYRLAPSEIEGKLAEQIQELSDIGIYVRASS